MLAPFDLTQGQASLRNQFAAALNNYPPADAYDMQHGWPASSMGYALLDAMKRAAGTNNTYEDGSDRMPVYPNNPHYKEQPVGSRKRKGYINLDATSPRFIPNKRNHNEVISSNRNDRAMDEFNFGSGEKGHINVRNPYSNGTIELKSQNSHTAFDEHSRYSRIIHFLMVM